MLPSRLLVVTNRHGATRPLVETVEAILAGGARWIWFRDKDLAPEPRRALAIEIQALTRTHGAVLSIGGDLDLAAAIGADGTHLGGGASAEVIAQVRDRLGEKAWIGISAHGPAEIEAAARAGAHYATLSPIFTSTSKVGYGPALGLGTMREAAGIGLPLIALGGIGPVEARACLEAGAAGVAVMGALMGAADPAGATRRLTQLLIAARQIKK